MKKLLLLFLTTFFTLSAHAMFSPIGFSFTHNGVDGQLPPEDWDVYGARFNLLSASHRRVVGIDIGVFSETKELFAGTQMSIWNKNEKTTRILGFQVGALANVNNGDTKGLGAQMSVFANYNKGKAHIIGVQAALVNVGNNSIYGMQFGLYNKAERIVGIQVGVINTCNNLHGLQIGLLNSCKSCLIPIMPGLNIGL